MQRPSRAQDRNSVSLGKLSHRLPAICLDMSCGHQQDLGRRIPSQRKTDDQQVAMVLPQIFPFWSWRWETSEIHYSPKHSLLSLSYLQGAAQHEITEQRSLKEETLPPIPFSLRDLRQKAFNEAPR